MSKSIIITISVDEDDIRMILAALNQASQAVTQAALFADQSDLDLGVTDGTELNLKSDTAGDWANEIELCYERVLTQAKTELVDRAKFDCFSDWLDDEDTSIEYHTPGTSIWHSQ